MQRLLYEQQREMYETHTNRIDNRIVSLSRPWVRPIVRGKQNAEAEFGAKAEMSDVNGFLRIEDFRWDAFNESTTLRTSVEAYRKAYGHYPKRVLADTIFRTSAPPLIPGAGFTVVFRPRLPQPARRLLPGSATPPGRLSQALCTYALR